MVLAVAASTVIESSIPSSDHFFPSREKFRAHGPQSVNALIRTLKSKPSANNYNTSPNSKDNHRNQRPHSGLQKASIGVFGFCCFAPKSDQSEGSPKASRLDDMSRPDFHSGLGFNSGLESTYLGQICSLYSRCGAHTEAWWVGLHEALSFQLESSLDYRRIGVTHGCYSLSPPSTKL